MPVILAGDFQQYGLFIMPVLLSVLTGALFSLVALLVKNKAWLAGSMVAAGFLPFVFSFSSSLMVWGALVGAILFLWSGVSFIRKEVEISVQYRTLRSARQGLGFYFTATVLVFSIFYLNRIDDRQVFSILFPQPLFDFVLRSFSGTIQGVTGLPKIQPEQTVNEVMTEMVRAQFQSQGIPLEKIPKKELNQLLTVQREEFSKAYNINIGGGEKIGTVFSSAVTAKIRDLVGRYNNYLPLVAAVAFFFAAKMISLILYFLSLLLTALLMKLLVLAKVVKKKTEQIEVERLVL